MTDIKERLRRTGEWGHDAMKLEAADRIEELEAALAWEKARTKTAVAAEREKINVAVTRLIYGYRDDDPIWYTVDHVKEVLDAYAIRNQDG